MSEKAKRGVNREIFMPELHQDEQILWMGQPVASQLFSAQDIFLIPFTLMWGGFMIFWFLGVITSGDGCFALFSVPFIIIGQYFIYGQFIYKFFNNRRTYYAVTESRLLILNTLFGNHLQTIFIPYLSVLNKTSGSGNIGTLAFDNFASLMQNRYSGRKGVNLSNTGIFWGSSLEVPGFYNIHDVHYVYQLITALQQAR